MTHNRSKGLANVISPRGAPRVTPGTVVAAGFTSGAGRIRPSDGQEVHDRARDVYFEQQLGSSRSRRMLRFCRPHRAAGLGRDWLAAG